MDFRILGRLEALDDGVDVAPRRAQPRALLAMFLLHPNELLTADRLIDALWGETPPATADKALQGHVSALRKAVGHERLVTERGGYRLEVHRGELDVDRFTAAVTAAPTEASPAARARALADALAIWRDEPLVDLASERLAQGDIARLAALRLSALEAWAAAELHAGNHEPVLAALERAVADHPLSEGLRASLMVALYRAGRQSDALRTYREGRRHLAEELGIDPGNELQQLERQILAHDPALDPPAAVPPQHTALRQERKQVTVLVVEVVPGDTTDPEDLERDAQPALARIRAAVEHVGGRAEPVFANALLGMFGAPAAHDDDALRAVRAALELLGAFEGESVSLRGGLETGEALVTIDGGSVAVTGHVLSAAARMQATAPLGSILVGPAAHRATEGMIDYLAHDDRSWAPQRARRADELDRPDPPFVGRADELGQLERVFARARDERSVQLVTVIAEPGGGKSRLVRELHGRLDAVADASAVPIWLQGRCLPYGDGVTFWALGEIVKHWAGILESDDAAVSADKLAGALAALEPDENRRTWLARSVGPLVGIEGAPATGDRERVFAAWRRLVEAIAAEQPLVVVFEDVHWADAALLAFIDHLVDHAVGVPLLVLCTARLQLLDANPTWAGGKRNATTILLRPLRDAETRQLLESILGREPGAETVRRAGGNPLYAHELAHLLARSSDEGASAIPESLHAVIAAHLDAITPDLKVVASDASVVGEVFWPGVIAEIGGLDPATVESRLHRLATNDVIRRRPRSSVAGEDEYEFLHVLVRDVAYGQIPRRDRIAKHRATAEWIERLAGDRITAHAELVAHHAVEAVELAQRFSDEHLPDLQAHAARVLVLAGDAARALDAARAEALYRRALDLTPAEDPTRARLLARLAEVAQVTRSLAEAESLGREAIAALEAQGDRQHLGAAMVSLAGALWRLGRADDERRRLLLGAIDVLEELPPTTELVTAYSQMAAHELYAIHAAACRDWSTKALDLAERLGHPALKSQPLQYLGIARFELGDSGGIADVREAAQLALESGLSWEAGNAQADLGAILWLAEGPAAGLAVKQAAAAFVGDRGLANVANAYRTDTLWYQYDAGDWDALLGSAEELLASDLAHGTTRMTLIAQSARARVLALRGATDAAVSLEGELLRRARALGDAQDVGPALGTAAAIRAAAGDPVGTLERIRELAEQTRGRDVSRRVHELPMVARLAVAAGDTELARSFIPDPAEGEPPFARASLCIATGRAVVAEVSGSPADALAQYMTLATGWAAYGCPLEEAHAKLGAARCLLELGRADEVAPLLDRVRSTARSLGAKPLLAAAIDTANGAGAGLAR